jgi:hypothetical protein
VTRQRADLDQLAHELRAQGLTYRAIAKWLGVTLAMTRRGFYGMSGPCARPGQSTDGHKALPIAPLGG